jgi:hypothetical protein
MRKEQSSSPLPRPGILGLSARIAHFGRGKFVVGFRAPEEYAILSSANAHAINAYSSIVVLWLKRSISILASKNARPIALNHSSFESTGGGVVRHHPHLRGVLEAEVVAEHALDLLVTNCNVILA